MPQTTRSPVSTQLLIIDPQNDFCDLPDDRCPLDARTGQRVAPALPVKGAHADMQRLARFIGKHCARIDGITVTLDSHQRYDVAHPSFWQRRDGSEVPPFTPILAKEVRDGSYAPRDPRALQRVLAYMDALETQGRYVLMVWPVHCVIGSWGHGVHADVLAACDEWQVTQRQAVRNVFKGMSPWTEHYSAIKAEVPDRDDPETDVNERLLRDLAKADRLVVGGEASSHCVRATVEDIVHFLPKLSPDWTPQRLVLLSDCMSPVQGFEREHAAFLDSMHTRGVQLAQSSELPF
ncbi:cysteine hydrolase family protein [Diaphorobacter aerolatus]|uniref:Cysteine hydrolase n=1 Tax=Diaphorobacter aerolatus TaxID=1288495 RepID=A0A7H0GNJ6_9BURK|nr:cysteine hydrolase [Diaphorobacter aerolatus]QNP49862.1 cysteine hydrolase [Diaphorobacter aerolatus]